MKYRLTPIGIVCFLFTAGFLGFITFESNVVSAGNVWYVGTGPIGPGENDTDSIQDAIVNLASPGDTVFVYSGVYFGGLWINKTINLIGEDKQTTIIDGKGGHVVWLSYANWVNITGFTITNGSTGIYSNQCSNNAFINNIVHGNSFNGFYFTGDPYWGLLISQVLISHYLKLSIFPLLGVT